MSVQWFDEWSWLRDVPTVVSPYIDITAYCGADGPIGSGADFSCRQSTNGTVKGVASCAEYWAGGLYYPVSSETIYPLLTFRDSSGNDLAYVRGYSDGHIAIVSAHDTATAIVTTAADVFPRSETNYSINIGARVKPGDGTGEAELWFANALVGSASSATIKGSGGQTGPIARICWNIAGAGWAKFSHIWAVAVDGVGRCTRLNNPRIAYAKVTGDTATADFVKSSGSDGWALVDEYPPNTADYIASTTVGQKSKFTSTPNWSITGKRVVAVKAGVTSIASSGSISQKASITSGSTEVTSAAQALTSSILQAFVIAERNPDGDAVWTTTTAAAALVGVEAA